VISCFFLRFFLNLKNPSKTSIIYAIKHIIVRQIDTVSLTIHPPVGTLFLSMPLGLSELKPGE
jgi:hypothetical protein